ncbi:MAG TPA: endonuclease NucS domain-containing protein [Vicinamibacterales bacterium]|nr:endonuclease NucS domain-containing protein [Vicinamibacterales bacterium]
MRITYFYRPSLLSDPDRQASHNRMCHLLGELESKGWEVATEDADTRFPTYAAQRDWLEKLGLRDFAVRRKVGLSRSFGSRKSAFAWLPEQVLLVNDGTRLCEVFPCRISGNEIEPLEYLEKIAGGQPWTTRSGKGMEGRIHKLLIDQVTSKPHLLETGLTLKGRDVHVAQDSEIGFVDLVFEDSERRLMLVEVKVQADELAKAVGQILWHRQLYCAQNSIAKERVRVAICCQYIPPQYRLVCAEQGIEWFQCVVT